MQSSGGLRDQEPWVFGEEITDGVRNFVHLRYQLLPYLYTPFWKYTNNETSILKSLVLYDQEAAATHYSSDAFVSGEQNFNSPNIRNKCKRRRMYIPRANWCHFWTDKFVGGGKELWVAADLRSLQNCIYLINKKFELSF